MMTCETSFTHPATTKHLQFLHSCCVCKLTDRLGIRYIGTFFTTGVQATTYPCFCCCSLHLCQHLWCTPQPCCDLLLDVYWPHEVVERPALHHCAGEIVQPTKKGCTGLIQAVLTCTCLACSHCLEQVCLMAMKACSLGIRKFGVSWGRAYFMAVFRRTLSLLSLTKAAVC
jgi:hypothetical protein